VDLPSYENAFEENPGLLSLRVLPIDPPSYTESVLEIQRQPLTGTEGPSKMPDSQPPFVVKRLHTHFPSSIN